MVSAAADQSRGAAAATNALAAAARLRGVPAPGLPVLRPPPTIRDSLALWHKIVLGRPASAALLAEDARAFAGLPRAYGEVVAMLADAMARAQQIRNDAVAGVTPQEIGFAERVALTAQFAPERVSRAEALNALSVIRRIDTASMMRAAASLSATIAGAKRLTASSSAPAEATCAASICVGSDGPDTYTSDVQLLIEPGGDDTYLNNAGGHMSSQMADSSGGCVSGGGTTGRGRPNLDCSPAPGTVCTYDTLNKATGRNDLPVVALPGHDEPGSGSLNEGSCGSDERRARLLADTQNIGNDNDSRGVAVLLDLGGSDTYTVPWSHEDPLFGLVDACYPGESAKVNTNRDLFQGGALAGISVLWDAGDGNDQFRGRLNVQGSGHVGGVGLLVAEGTGDDLFWADRLSQGNGIAGGVGILVNAKNGNHTYLLDAPVVYRNEFRPNGRDCVQEGRAGQGEGGFGGVGVLWSSHDGGAVYRAVTQVTQNAYPYAPVLDGGAPLLLAGTDAQGSGESFPIPDTPGGLVAGAGLLFDNTGGDASVCAPAPSGDASAGMLTGSATSTGTDLSTHGAPDACGTLNMPPEIAAEDLAAALAHLTAGAVGLRVVI
jgi:hypothetical protein